MIECIYNCPYCGEETGTYLTIYPYAYDLIDNGGFYKLLKYIHYKEKDDVFFGKN